MANLQSLTVNDTGNLTLPSATRPSLFSNTAIQWTNTGSQAFTVLAGSGGTVSNTSWTCPTGVTSIEVLVVAGGGAGGSAGGGGAGGLIYNSAFPVVPGTAYSVTVGTGGAGFTGAGSANAIGVNGTNSVFGTLTAIGGGGGGAYGTSNINGASGGSGGGAGHDTTNAIAHYGGAGTAGQGFPGGDKILWYSNGPYSGAGGGGAGGKGADAVGPGKDGGNGGPGLAFSISGTSYFYAGGGGGGAQNGSGFGSTAGNGGVGGGGGGAVWTANSGTPNVAGLGGKGGVNNGADGINGSATPNCIGGAAGASTGGGGGGMGISVNVSGNGGSGVVIIRFTLATSTTQPVGQLRFNTAPGVVETFSAGNTWEIDDISSGIVSNGIVTHLSATSFITSNTTWTDVSNRGNDATLTGTPSYTAGSTIILPSYFTLAGTGAAYGTLPVAMFNYTATAAFTFETWVYPTGYGSPTQQYLQKCILGKGNVYMNFGVYTDGKVQLYHYDGNPRYSYSAGTVPLNTWSHVVATVENGLIKYFINGRFSGTAVWYGISSVGWPESSLVGKTNAGETGGWLGRLSTIRVYSRALLEREVLQNYNTTRISYDRPQVNGNIGSTIDNPAPSAMAIKRLTGTTTNGYYWILPAGFTGQPKQVWCDMTNAGGGWMLMSFCGPSVTDGRHVDDFEVNVPFNMFSQNTSIINTGQTGSTAGNLGQPFIDALVINGRNKGVACFRILNAGTTWKNWYFNLDGNARWLGVEGYRARNKNDWNGGSSSGVDTVNNNVTANTWLKSCWGGSTQNGMTFDGYTLDNRNDGCGFAEGGTAAVTGGAGWPTYPGNFDNITDNWGYSISPTYDTYTFASPAYSNWNSAHSQGWSQPASYWLKIS